MAIVLSGFYSVIRNRRVGTGAVRDGISENMNGVYDGSCTAVAKPAQSGECQRVAITIACGVEFFVIIFDFIED